MLGSSKPDPLEGRELGQTVANKFIVADKPGNRKVYGWKRKGKGRNDVVVLHDELCPKAPTANARQRRRENKSQRRRQHFIVKLNVISEKPAAAVTTEPCRIVIPVLQSFRSFPLTKTQPLLVFTTFVHTHTRK